MSGWKEVEAIRVIGVRIQELCVEIRAINGRIASVNEDTQANTRIAVQLLNVLVTSGVKMKGVGLGL